MNVLKLIKSYKNSYKICKKCNYECYAKHFQQNFQSWTRCSNSIDKFIQDTQLSCHYNISKAFEWISYDRLTDIKAIAKGWYEANWIDGNMIDWDSNKQNWKRENQNMIVNLRYLEYKNINSLEFVNETSNVYGITQDPETKNYIIIIGVDCKKCNHNHVCYARYFLLNFENWTSGNYDIDKFIQSTQLLCHHDVRKALEWLPYDRLTDIKDIAKDWYRANWIDGNMIDWDSNKQNWKRENQNMIVSLICLGYKNINLLEFVNEISVAYGITQDPETKNYIIVLSDDCKKCNHNRVCYRRNFLLNFKNWTSGNYDIDKFIQSTQLSCHYDVRKALEWLPYDRLTDINVIAKDCRYIAKWIDGNIIDWNSNTQSWIRENQNMVVMLEELNNLKNIDLKIINIKKIGKVYGITQDPQTKKFIMVLGECKVCDSIERCYARYFILNFENWTSGNNDIDKFIQDTQLSCHFVIRNALEWISYDRFNKIKCIAKGKYEANWLDGNMVDLKNNMQNLERENQNMKVILKEFHDLEDIEFKFINKITSSKFYGITQNPETKNYIMVLNNTYDKKCEHDECILKYIKQNFKNWTSEWIPYDRFYNIKYIAKDNVYRANWIDGSIIDWDKKDHNWKRKNQSIMKVNLKRINYNNIKLEFVNEINKVYGITRNPETKNYMIVLSGNLSNGCNDVCYAIHAYFKKNFWRWTSGNESIDYFIRYNQLSVHYEVSKVLEWIPFDRFCDIKYIAKGGFGRVYKAYWIDGNMIYWDNDKENWKRAGQKLVALKSLNNSENVTSEFMNEIMLHDELDDSLFVTELYGITQDLETKNYMLVLEYAEDGNLRNYLDTNYNKLNLKIISGLPPYHNLSHDNNLAMKICLGLRPMFNNKVPQLIVHLIKRCLDANLSNRPTAIEIRDEIWEFLNDTSQNQFDEKINYNLPAKKFNFNKFSESKNSDEYYGQNNDIINNKFSESLKYNFLNENDGNLNKNLQKQVDEKINDNLPISNNSLTSSLYTIHSEAIYTSRSLDFLDNLPEPKNSDDYYEQNDNIISNEFSESLKFNFLNENGENDKSRKFKGKEKV
ncbi:kinase-like domain-containing protein [Rhizophagus clarus]|uniref:Kinase-like domain-containing protein n=1 Tax=Rhizophagus clarus TaxID=94130 RepID=A0A8H3LRN6_9GLOM|nr:kinase-like domain-containing protein [Rhizophagus clarus]